MDIDCSLVDDPGYCISVNVDKRKYEAEGHVKDFFYYIVLEKTMDF